MNSDMRSESERELEQQFSPQSVCTHTGCTCSGGSSSKCPELPESERAEALGSGALGPGEPQLTLCVCVCVCV